MNKKWINPTTNDYGKSTKIYLLWKSIKHRCCNENNKDYHNYGGRGIWICDRWLNFDNFYEWILTSNYEEGLQIDRIDNDFGYCPENCHFVSHGVNQLNKRPMGKIKIKGVHKRRNSEKYIACKWINGKSVHIGTYDSIEEAEEAYLTFSSKGSGGILKAC